MKLTSWSNWQRHCRCIPFEKEPQRRGREKVGTKLSATPINQCFVLWNFYLYRECCLEKGGSDKPAGPKPTTFPDASSRFWVEWMLLLLLVLLLLQTKHQVEPESVRAFLLNQRSQLTRGTQHARVAGNGAGMGWKAHVTLTGRSYSPGSREREEWWVI